MKPTKRKRKGGEAQEVSVEQLLEKRFINTYIGSGVFAKTNIEKSAFVCTYTGETLSGKEGEARLKASNGPGCYVYFFKANGKYLCVDGTKSSCIGKFINDDHKKPNCKVVLKGQDLQIFTIRDIVQGEELRYDYGDKESFWRKKKQQGEVFYDLPNDDGSDSRNEPSSISENDSSSSSPGLKSSNKGKCVRDDDGSDSRNEPSSISENDSSSSSPGFKSSNKGKSLRDDDGSDSRNEPSSVTENDSSSSSPGFKSGTIGKSVRDDDGSDSRNEPSSISENDSSSSSPGFKSSNKGKSVRDDDGSDSRNELSSISENDSSSSSPGLKSSNKGKCVRDDDGNDSRNEPSSVTENDSSSSSPGFKSSNKGKRLRDDDGSDSRNLPSSVTENDSSSSSPGFKSGTIGKSVRDDDGNDSRNEPSSVTENDSSSSSPGFKSSNKGKRLRDDDGSDSRNEPSSVTENDSSSSSPGFKSGTIGKSVRDDDGNDSRNEPSSVTENDSSSSSPGFKSSNKGKRLRESDVSETESFDDTDNDRDFSLESDYVSDSSSNTSEIIPKTVFPALTMEKKSSKCVKLPSYKQKPVDRLHDEVSSTTDDDSNRKTKITVQTSNNENGRKWDKTQYCLFCEKGYTNIRKHYIKTHKTETEVQKILCMPMKSKERTAELTRLRNAGNYKHNVSVLKEESGEFVVAARQSNVTKPEDYLPCDDCLGFFLREGLWRHKQVCPLRTGKQKSRRVQADAALLLPASNAIHAGLKENVFGKMIRDEVTIAARNDTIILKVGEKLYQKHGHLTHLYSHISQKMRELGRFLICSKTQDLSINCLNDILRPEKFPLAVQSTKVLCEFSEVTNSYKNPSLALKIGHLLKKCAKVAKSEALINGDVERGSRADNFLTICEDEWTDEISSSALQTLTRNKMNKGHLLPLSEDIMRLKKFLDQKTESLLETLNERFDKAEWELLNQMTLAQLVMFNRRRGGETQRMLVDAYSSRMQNNDCPQEVTEALTAVERILLNTLSRVEIRGKRGRTVPVLLTQKAQRCIELLLRWRDTAGVAKDNVYVFPRPNYGSLQALRSADVLRTFSKAAGLINPELITSTRLRKHVATVAQVLSLNKNDLDIMASFMGHDITVHRSFYRLPQETLQVARMGRLLTAFNNGTVGQFSGKSIDEIPLDETAELSSDEEIEENDDQENEVENPESSDTDHLTLPVAMSSTVTLSGQPKRLQKLSEEQSRLLKTLFKTNIALRRELRREDCEKVTNKYEVLNKLSWQKIKNTVHNWITWEKRKTKKLL